jgi:hypothetical protein
MDKLTALSLAVLLIGCGARSGPVAEPDTGPAPEPEPEPEPRPDEPVMESVPRGFETVEALGEAFVEAVGGGDPESIRTFFPPDEVVLSAFQCPGEHKILEEIEADREGFISELQQLGSFQIEWIGLVPRQESVTNIHEGDDVRGCTAVKAVTIKEVVGKYLLTQGGQTSEETQDVAVGRFGADGRWYLLKLL